MWKDPPIPKNQTKSFTFFSISHSFEHENTNGILKFVLETGAVTTTTSTEEAGAHRLLPRQTYVTPPCSGSRGNNRELRFSPNPISTSFRNYSTVWASKRAHRSRADRQASPIGTRPRFLQPLASPLLRLLLLKCSCLVPLDSHRLAAAAGATALSFLRSLLRRRTSRPGLDRLVEHLVWLQSWRHHFYLYT